MHVSILRRCASSSKLPAVSSSVLYRQLLKCFIRKFDTDTETIVKAWRQTKYEFYFFRDAEGDELELVTIRGQQVLEAIRGGVIPVLHDPATNQSYCRYDAETIAAAQGVLEPLDAEEFVRRYQDKIPVEARSEMMSKLMSVGRWKGPDEFIAQYKKVVRRRKQKCTDEDEVPPETMTT